MLWVQNRLATLVAAGRSPSNAQLALIGVAFLGIVGQLIGAVFGVMIPLVPYWFWAALVLFALVLWLVEVAHHYKTLLDPKLEIQFDRNDPLCFHYTYRGNDEDDKVVYVAVVPRSLGKVSVKGCQGFLNAVWLLGPDGNWQGTPFVNRLPLEWGAAGWGTAEIDNITNQALNVFYVAKRDPKIHPLTQGLLNKDRKIFHDKENRIFRFDVVIKGENGPPSQISLQAKLGDQWDTLEVNKI